MKLGVAGLLGDGSLETARRVRELGFAAASWHLRDPDLAEDEDALLQVRDNLHQEDVRLVQLLPPLYPSLVHHDPETRRAGVEVLARVIHAAAIVGADHVYVRPGSLNDAGPWTPHPDNHAPETRARLIESLRLLAPHAEAARVPLALEGHVVSPLDTAAAVREVLEAVGSPLLRFNADPVNFVRDLDQAYHSTALIHELFDTLGAATVAAHVKDVAVEDRLVVHIRECVPGQGHLDLETFLRRFDECCPQGVVLIEHLPAERVPEARRALLEYAARAGLAFQEE